MPTFTIWEGERCGFALNLGEGPPKAANGTVLDPEAVKVATFEAATWEAACQRYNDHYDFGPYVPPEGGWEPIPQEQSR